METTHAINPLTLKDSLVIIALEMVKLYFVSLLLIFPFTSKGKLNSRYLILYFGVSYNSRILSKLSSNTLITIKITYKENQTSILLFCLGAYRDKDGYYWITGRIDDLMNVSGHLLSTAQVESALVEHSSISEAAVVGFPHEVKGNGIYCCLLYTSPSPRDS